jgi:dephospho-CoA kinase
VEAERQRLLRRAGQARDAVVISEIPLLFETMDLSRFEAIVLVDAPESVRLERLAQHRGLPAAEAAALIDAQLASAEKRARADFIIDNDGSRDLLRERAWQVFRKLLSRARARA